MASAGGIRMGGVFVEIGADPKKFFAAYNSVQKSLGNLGKNLMTGGTRLAAAGIGMAAPIVAAVKQGANFESTLLNIRASTGATAAEIDKIKASSMGMSEALGVGPTAAAQGMLELLKAGMSLDAVLGGAGKSALEFAKVGEMDVANAAVVMRDAMNVFGVSGEKAANTLSGAADASSTSIAQIVEAFSNVGATGKDANQTIETLSAAVAILGNNMVKGGDAGTALKSMMLRLTSGADGAAEGLASIGLSTESFRDADQNFLPLGKAMDVLRSRLDGLGAGDRAKALYKIFGSYGLKAATILLNAGSQGFADMEKEIANALPVSAKFQMLMSGMAGMGEKVLSALQRLAIAVSGAVAPALSSVVPAITGFINGLTNLVRANPEVVAGFAKFAVALIAAGGAMVGLGAPLVAAAAGMGALGKVAAFAVSPLALVAKAALGVGASFAAAVPGVAALTAGVAVAMTKGTASVLGFASTSARGFASFASAGIGSVRTAVAALSPAFSLVSRGLAAIASDAARLAGPLVRPFVDAGRSVMGFATTTATGIGSYVSSIASAVTASVTGAARIAGAWLSQAAGAVGRFVAGALAPIATYIASVGAAAVATVASAARIAGAWLVSTFPAISAFVVSSTAGIAKYIASTVAAAVASVTNAARSGAAWVASGMPGVLTFVGTAVAGLARYVGAAAAAVASSVASAAGVAAAWLAPLAPVLALSAAIGGAGILASRFGGQVGSALGGIGDLAGQAGESIASTFSVVLADATTVFGDLYSTATTTFSGIYDAITAGDLSGAMDVLWVGLTAGWLRGTEAIMSYVDPWLATFNNAFTILGAEIYKTWDGLWVMVGNALNVAGAYLMGAMDNIINPILAAWDYLEAGIRKTWIRISGIFQDADAKQRELDKVDADMKGRAEKRAKDRPGILARAEKAQAQNAKANIDLRDRQAAVDANTQEIMQGRLDALGGNAQARRDATLAAEGRLRSLVGGQAETRVQNAQADDLLAAIRGATSVDQLAGVGGLGDQFMTLKDLGRLTTEQEGAISDALDKAAEGLTRVGISDNAGAAGSGGPAVTPPDVSSRVSAAGTFSSLNLGQMFGGTSLAERTAKAAEETAKNTRKIDDGGKVAA